MVQNFYKPYALSIIYNKFNHYIHVLPNWYGKQNLKNNKLLL